jgi:hypothetical protein
MARQVQSLRKRFNRSPFGDPSTAITKVMGVTQCAVNGYVINWALAARIEDGRRNTEVARLHGADAVLRNQHYLG